MKMVDVPVGAVAMEGICIIPYLTMSSQPEYMMAQHLLQGPINLMRHYQILMDNPLQEHGNC